MVRAEEQRQLSKSEISALIWRTAHEHGIDGNAFYGVAKCESSLNPNAVGDGDNSYGLFQIHIPSHPTVSIEEALDPHFAVEWSAKKFKESPEIWTCYNLLYEPIVTGATGDTSLKDEE